MLDRPETEEGLLHCCGWWQGVSQAEVCELQVPAGPDFVCDAQQQHNHSVCVGCVQDQPSVLSITPLTASFGQRLWGSRGGGGAG